MEITKEVKTIQVDYKCPKCNQGYLRPTGIVLTSHPPQFLHHCNNPKCEHAEIFKNHYPYIDYQEV